MQDDLPLAPQSSLPMVPAMLPEADEPNDSIPMEIAPAASLPDSTPVPYPEGSFCTFSVCGSMLSAKEMSTPISKWNDLSLAMREHPVRI